MGNRAHATLCFGFVLPDGWFEALPDGWFEHHPVPPAAPPGQSDDDDEGSYDPQHDGEYSLPPLYDEDASDDEPEDSPDRALRAALGVGEQDPDASGVAFLNPGEAGSALIYWHPSMHDTDWDDPLAIDPTKLVTPGDEVTARIAALLHTLGITPRQPPGWILVASYH